MRHEAHIAAYAIAHPPLVSSDKIVECMSKDLRSAGKSEGLSRKVMFMCKSSKIHSRPLSLARFHAGTSNAEVMYLGKPAGIPWAGEIAAGEESRDLLPEERSALWADIAPKLCVEAAQKALKKWSGTAADITHVLVTNTSGWKEPGLGSHLIRQLGLPETTQKAELNFNGCFCGLTCLSLARDIIRADAAKRAVLVVGCELACLHWSRAGDDSNLLASSLFADGAAAFIIATEGDWRFKDNGTAIIPNSSDMLVVEPTPRPGEVQTSGAYRLRLSPLVAATIGNYFKDGSGNQMLTKILAKNFKDCTPELAIHPGGPRILEVLGEVLTQSFGFNPTALQPSFGVLHTYGNLASTAILFVLHEVLSSTQNSQVLSMAFGPGVIVEWAALERV